MPSELRTTLVAAVFAALGFVGKLAIDQFSTWRDRTQKRLASLGTFRSLLLAAKAAHRVQWGLIDALVSQITAGELSLNHGDIETALARAHEGTQEQRISHGLIREYSVSAMKPLNEEMLQWLKSDNFWKAARLSDKASKLASALCTLEAHLTMWLAKYNFQLEGKPERAIVYIMEEASYGVGFPKEIDQLVASSCQSRWLI